MLSSQCGTIIKCMGMLCAIYFQKPSLTKQNTYCFTSVFSTQSNISDAGRLSGKKRKTGMEKANEPWKWKIHTKKLDRMERVTEGEALLYLNFQSAPFEIFVVWICKIKSAWMVAPQLQNSLILFTNLRQKIWIYIYIYIYIYTYNIYSIYIYYI